MNQDKIEQIAKIIDPEAFGLPVDLGGNDYLTDRDEARYKAVKIIKAITTLELLLAMEPEDRVEAINEIRYNDVFCACCGIGSIEQPNESCQCWNDE